MIIRIFLSTLMGILGTRDYSDTVYYEVVIIPGKVS